MSVDKLVSIYKARSSNSFTASAVVFTDTPSSTPSLVITPTSYAVEYGSTVLMTCVAYLGPDTEDYTDSTISWLDPREQQLGNDSDNLVSIYTQFQNYSGSVFLESILEICSLNATGAGQYTCTASSLSSDTMDSFSWNISFTDEPGELNITVCNLSMCWSEVLLILVCEETSPILLVDRVVVCR